jgi:hypothetical protein
MCHTGVDWQYPVWVVIKGTGTTSTTSMKWVEQTLYGWHTVGTGTHLKAIYLLFNIIQSVLMLLKIRKNTHNHGSTSNKIKKIKILQ